MVGKKRWIIISKVIQIKNIFLVLTFIILEAIQLSEISIYVIGKLDLKKDTLESSVINKSSGGYLLYCRRKLIINGLLLQNHTG